MTIYYETARHGLIPCRFLGYAKTPIHDVTGCYNVVIKLRNVANKECGYQSGEILHVPGRLVVEKAGRRDYHQLVRPAALPVRTDENTRESRM